MRTIHLQKRSLSKRWEGPRNLNFFQSSPHNRIGSNLRVTSSPHCRIYHKEGIRSRDQESHLTGLPSIKGLKFKLFTLSPNTIISNRDTLTGLKKENMNNSTLQVCLIIAHPIGNVYLLINFCC